MQNSLQTTFNDAVVLHHSIGFLKVREQLAFATDCVRHLPLRKLFCPEDRLFLKELVAVVDAVACQEEGAADTLALMIPLTAELSENLYTLTEQKLVDVVEHHRNMAASHLVDAYLGLAEFAYAYAHIQHTVVSANDIARHVRQASYWMSNSLEREKYELVFQQKRAEKHLKGIKGKQKASAEIIPFPVSKVS